MRIDSTIVQAYISGANLCEYKNEWFFSGSTLDVEPCKNIFTLPRMTIPCENPCGHGAVLSPRRGEI